MPSQLELGITMNGKMNKWGAFQRQVPSKRWDCVSLDISSSQKKTSFDITRFPDTTEYKRNWFDLGQHLQIYDHDMRVKHIEIIAKRTVEVAGRKDPAFLQLMYLLRLEGIIFAYFDKEEVGKYLPSQFATADHPGWNDVMTVREQRILNLLSSATNALKNGVDEKACKMFTDADKKFGWYRHQRWLCSLE